MHPPLSTDRFDAVKLNKRVLSWDLAPISPQKFSGRNGLELAAEKSWKNQRALRFLECDTFC